MNGSRERASLTAVMLVDATGARNDGFLPNSLITLFRLSSVFFRSLEMHSKRRYKIYIFSVILCRETRVFFKLQRLRYYFPENVRCNLAHYEKEIFFDSSLHHILNPKVLGFLFPTKNGLTWVVKCKKSNFRKSQGI